MSGFIHPFERVVTRTENPQTGARTEVREDIPRNLPALTDKVWKDTEFLVKTLQPEAGAVREFTSKSGNTLQAMDIFLRGVGGPAIPNRDGSRYSRLRLCSILSGVTVDEETGEQSRWFVVTPEGERQQGQTSSPASQENDEDGAESASKAEVVSEEVESI